VDAASSRAHSVWAATLAGLHLQRGPRDFPGKAGPVSVLSCLLSDSVAL
jgi:hypothetical protein